MEPEVVNYIKSARDHGLNETEIKQNLLNAGWDANVVEESFAHARSLENQSTTTREESLKWQSQIKTSGIIAPEILNPVSEPVAHANIAISQKNFASKPTVSSKKPLFWALGIILVVILSGGGYWFLAYGGFYTPQTVWKKFTQAVKTPIYQNNFSIGYFDQGELTKSENQGLGLELKDIKLTFNGKFYINGTEEKNPESTSEIQYTFGSGNTNFSTGFSYKLKDKILYLNIGDNPFLNNIFNSISPGKKIDWLKLDLNAVEDEINKQSAQDAKKFSDIFNNNFQKELAKIWEDSTFVKVNKFLGKETINGVSTLHFSNTVEMSAINTAVINSVNKIASAINDSATTDVDKITDDNLNTVKLVVNELTNKMQIKQFETWVGVKDFRLYQIKFVSNAPSFISLIKTANQQSAVQSQDAKRLADIRQMASAFELYYNDNNGYPAGSNGSPIGLDPNYIGKVPVAPTPPSGNCTDYYNTYWYEPKGTKITSNGKTVYSSYELTFCLGSNTGGYTAGIAKLSPTGLESNISCPTTADQCASSSQVQPELTEEQKIKDFISKLDFTAEFKIDANYSNYGKKQEITPPDNAFDLLEVIKGKVQGAITLPNNTISQ